MLKDLPPYRRRRRDSPRSNSHQPIIDDASIQKSIASSPTLLHLLLQSTISTNSINNTFPSSPFAKLIHQVGPIASSRLLQMIVRHPNRTAQLLTSNNIRSKDVQLCQLLQLTDQQFHTLRHKFLPYSYERLTRSDILHTFVFFQKDLGLTPETVQKIIQSKPILFTYATSNLFRTAQYLQDEMDLSTEDLSRSLRHNPLLLTYSIDHRLRPVIEYIRDELQMNRCWKKILMRYPQLFSHSVETKLKPQVQMLHNRLDLKRSSDVAQIITIFPPALWLSEETIMSKVSFLQAELSFHDQDIRNILVSFPQILGLSIEQNLRPKIEFFLSRGENGGAGMTLNQLQEFVLYQPSLLAYSLERRIRPRIRRMHENNIIFGYTPPYLMSKTDEVFDKWLETHVGDWSVHS